MVLLATTLNNIAWGITGMFLVYAVLGLADPSAALIAGMFGLFSFGQLQSVKKVAVSKLDTA